MGSKSDGRFADVVSQYTFGANILYGRSLLLHFQSLELTTLSIFFFQVSGRQTPLYRRTLGSSQR